MGAESDGWGPLGFKGPLSEDSQITSSNNSPTTSNGSHRSNKDADSDYDKPPSGSNSSASSSSGSQSSTPFTSYFLERLNEDNRLHDRDYVAWKEKTCLQHVDHDDASGVSTAPICMFSLLYLVLDC